MALKTWINGEKGGIVKQIVEHNFKLLYRHLSQNLLSLSTIERETLTEDYLSEGLIAYDKTQRKWFEYTSGQWREKDYVRNFAVSDWSDSNIIHIPYSTHKTVNPDINLFFFYDDEYHPVFGGVSVDADYNITISTDMPFTGKVVIK